MQHSRNSGTRRRALFSLCLAVLPTLNPLCGLAAPSEPHWWEQGVSRLISVSTGYEGPNKFDPASLAARKSQLGFDAERLTIFGRHAGMDDQGLFFVSAAAGKTNEDYLRRYLPEAKKYGLRSAVFFDVHHYNTNFAAQHPGWMQHNEDGSLPRIYDTGVSPCINSPYRDWVFQVLRDLAAYPIDGIFFDGPIFFPNSCYCDYCQRKWSSQHPEQPLPSKKERAGPAFARLVDFQAHSIADFLRDANRTLKQINPELALYMNSGVRGANWASGRLNRVLIPHEDILGSEGGFLAGDLTRLSLWKPGLTARLLEAQSGGKPTQIFTAASHKPWTFSLLPAPELGLSFFQSIANGAACSFAFTPIDLNQPETDAVTPLNRYLAQNQKYYVGTRSEARTALVWSDVTANFYAGAAAQMIDIDRVAARSDIGNLDGEFIGLADSLVRSHTPFDVIDDVTLDRESLDRYDTIILPNVACMSDQVAARLSEWVKRGGALLATFETSLYDETGLRRTNFALADVFGTAMPGRIVGPTPHDFMQPLVLETNASSTRPKALLEATTYHLAVTPATAKASLQFMKPLAGRYDGLPQPGEDAALLLHPWSKGRAVYFSGDLGNTIQTFHLAAHLDLFRPWFASPITISNAPGSVEVVLRSQNNGARWLLHLINATGEMTRPLRNILPVHNITVTLPVSHPVRTITAVQSARSFPAAQSFSLPLLKDYELLIIE